MSRPAKLQVLQREIHNKPKEKEERSKALLRSTETATPIPSDSTANITEPVIAFLVNRDHLEKDSILLTHVHSRRNLCFQGKPRYRTARNECTNRPSVGFTSPSTFWVPTYWAENGISMRGINRPWRSIFSSKGIDNKVHTVFDVSVDVWIINFRDEVLENARMVLKDRED